MKTPRLKFLLFSLLALLFFASCGKEGDAKSMVEDFLDTYLVDNARSDAFLPHGLHQDDNSGHGDGFAGTHENRKAFQAQRKLCRGRHSQDALLHQGNLHQAYR